MLQDQVVPGDRETKEKPIESLLLQFNAQTNLLKTWKGNV